MAEAKPSGGVKNLRAMFENPSNNANSNTSPPSRGRSPADSNASNTERPLSKVRANFVAVERTLSSGGTQIGLRSSSEAGRQTPIGLKQNTSVAENGSPPQKFGSEQAQKMDAVSVTTSNGHAQSPSQQKDRVGLNRKPSVKQTSTAAESLAAPSSAPTKLPEVDSSSSPERHEVSLSKNSKPERGVETTMVQSRTSPSKVTKSAPVKTAPVKKPATTSRPQDISTTNPSSKPNSKTSPTLPKTPSSAGSPDNTKKTPSKQASKPTATEKSKVVQDRAVRASLASAPHSATGARARASSRPRGTSTTRTASKARTPVASHPILPTHSSPNSKPRPRSPTRPVRLPASATAPTAASAAKLGSTAPPARSQSRAGQTTTTQLSRKPSTLKKEHTSTTASKPSTKTTSLRKQPSRASLPAHGQEKPSTASGAKPSQDGFLARMMRPTASSASKTHEKTEIKSPPRKSAGKLRRKSGESVDDKQDHPTKSQEDKTLKENIDSGNRASAAEVEVVKLNHTIPVVHELKETESTALRGTVCDERQVEEPIAEQPIEEEPAAGQLPKEVARVEVEATNSTGPEEPVAAVAKSLIPDNTSNSEAEPNPANESHVQAEPQSTSVPTVSADAPAKPEEALEETDLANGETSHDIVAKETQSGEVVNEQNIVDELVHDEDAEKSTKDIVPEISSVSNPVEHDVEESKLDQKLGVMSLDTQPSSQTAADWDETRKKAELEETF